MRVIKFVRGFYKSSFIESKWTFNYVDTFTWQQFRKFTIDKRRE